jgi:antitoxin component of MazEF toxin-antitoxin module
MTATVQKRGNSLALRIPKSLALESHIEKDSLVDVSLVDGRIIVTLVPKRNSHWKLCSPELLPKTFMPRPFQGLLSEIRFGNVRGPGPHSRQPSSRT